MNDLDPKGVEAAVAAWEEAFLPAFPTPVSVTSRNAMGKAIRAYLSATVPAGDAVEAALATWWAADPGPTDTSYREAMIAALAASRLSQGTGVRVKALEWKPAFWNRSDPDYEHIVEIWEAFGAGHIQGWVEQQKDGKFYTDGEQFDTLDAAKAAVQAKHERIIRSALSGDTL